MDKFNFKKKYGQNFLRDDSVVSKIVNESNIPDNTLVIEVGPGAGILTKFLACSARNVLCYEIDRDLESTLNTNLKNYTNVDIIFDDFLKRNIVDDISNYAYDQIYFISNVPYYITTPILMHIMESGLNIDKIVMMIQKEVGDRFAAKPGKKEYSSITVFLNYYYQIKKLFYVSREEFVPKPNVDSVVISLERKENVAVLNDDEKFFKLVRDSFKFKRKNLKNNLKGYPLDKIESVLQKYNYDLSVRAEELDTNIFVDISNSI